MTAAGDIRSGPFATRAKEYVWSTIADAFPRGITPTDIDGMVEINRCYFIFEGKTEGASIPTGQGLAHRRHLLDLPEGRAVFVVGEHSAIDRVDVDTDLRSLKLAWAADGEVRWHPPLPGCIANIAALFVRDANAGRLNVERWHAEALHAMRPFEEAS